MHNSQYYLMNTPAPVSETNSVSIETGGRKSPLFYSPSAFDKSFALPQTELNDRNER
jgi:hypothetical protein